jgi:ketosteroid isomerase-like protein
MENSQIAKRLLLAWTSGDFETTRAVLAEDVSFTGPLGLTHGADKYVEGVRGFSHQIAKAEIKLAFGEGHNVCLIYDLVTKDGTRLPTAGHYQVTDGKVTAVRAYFDPRPLDATVKAPDPAARPAASSAPR